MIVKPIKSFYAHATWRGGPFKSYENDVQSLHKNEFEACLLYLRNVMEAIDFADILSIRELRNHRNDLAHDLVKKLPSLHIGDYRKLWEKVDRALFKLSNHRTIMEIGGDPEFQRSDMEWETVYGVEYMLFNEVFKHVKLLDSGWSQE